MKQSARPSHPQVLDHGFDEFGLGDADRRLINDELIEQLFELLDIFGGEQFEASGLAVLRSVV